MAQFRSDDSSAPRQAAWSAPRSDNPAEQHTLIGAGTTLEGSLRTQGNFNVSTTVVFDGRCEMGASVPPATRPPKADAEARTS